MIPELFAELRGLFGGVANSVSHPLVLFWLLLGIYFLWRRTGKT